MWSSLRVVVTSVRVRRVVERLLALAALAVCVGFVAGLTDVARVPLAPPVRRAPPPPSHLAVSTASLEVVVVAKENGGPIPGAQIRVFWEHERKFYEAGFGSADSAGKASFGRLPRGKTWVLADAPGRARSSTELVLGEERRSATLSLTIAHSVRVSVTDEQGRALERATVLVYGTDTLPYGALTGPAGDVRVGRLGPPPWTVKVSARGFESITKAGTTGDTSVVLRRLGTLLVAVQGHDRKPAPGATVYVGGTSLWPAREAKTGPEGTVRIGGLLDGVYDLRAVSADLVSDTLVGVELDRGAERSVTLTLRTGRTVTAWVTDGDDEMAPVAGADVVLVEEGLSPFPLRGRTNAEGRVRLGPIGDGLASLGARADGFVVRAAVPVPPGTGEPVRIALLRGATLRGEVVDERGFGVDGASVEVVGTDFEGLPVAETPMTQDFQRVYFEWSLVGPGPLIPMGELGVLPGPVPPIPGNAGSAVLFDPSEPVDPWPQPRGSIGGWVTDVRGEFQAHPVTPGRIRAIVRHPAYLQALSDWARVGPGQSATVRIVLRQGAVLEGRVTDDRGWPVAGSMVTLSAYDRAFATSTITAEDGTFAFASVPDRVVITASRPEDADSVVLRREVEVDQQRNARLELALPPQRDELRILVVDDQQQPVDAAQVLITSMDPEVPLRRTLFTSPSGTVSVPDVRGLKIRIVAEAPGWTRAVVLVDAASAEMTVRLSRGVKVTGRVTAVRGRQLVAGATVTVLAEGSRGSGITNQDGEYVVSDVEPGPVTLVVSHPQYATGRLQARVEQTARADRAFELPEVDLKESAVVRGMVVDSKGDPVAGARVAEGVAPAYLPAGSLPRTMAITDAAGRFEIKGLEPGKLSFEAYAPGVGRGRLEGIEVSPDRPASDLSITLAGETSDSDPAAGATVAVTLGQAAPGPAGAPHPFTVLHVAEGSDAEQSGVRRGDRLVRIDGTAPSSLEDARAHLSGAAGSNVLVELDRHGNAVALRLLRETVRR